MPDVVEQYTWWRARWGDESWSPPETDYFRANDNAERAARQFADGLTPDYGAVVECRTVTRTEWRPAEGEAMS